MKLNFSAKFYWGIILVVLSVILGKIATVAFFLYIKEYTIQLLAIITYIISWVLLIFGLWWMGKEGADAIRKYLSYKFYHERAKSGAKRAVEKGKVVKEKAIKQTKNLKGKASRKTKKLQKVVGKKTKSLKNQVKKKTRAVQETTKKVIKDKITNKQVKQKRKN